MSIYFTIYQNLCQAGKLRISEWAPGSNLHRHHITPRHVGGEDGPENLTYLTIREHIIAHFLLWKIYRRPNDLRSMKLLGAKLTHLQRKIVGEWCRDNKIGIHSEHITEETRRKWRERGHKSQECIEGSYVWWSSPAGRIERARRGGKASILSGNNLEFQYWCSPEGQKQRAKLGAAASPRKSATNGSETRKFYTVEERQKFLDRNPDWRIGCPKRGPQSEETRRKISERTKGKVVSEESRRKMSESAKRRKPHIMNPSYDSEL